MQAHAVRTINLGGRFEGFGDLLFRLAQNDTRLALAFRLRLPAHRIFQGGRNNDIPDFDGLDRYAPRGRALVDDLLQIGVQLVAPNQDFG